MNSGWRYRLASVTGVVLIAALAVILVNNATVQTAAAMLPVLERLPPDPPAGAEFGIEVGLTAAVVTGAFVPLYKPRPRQILDIVVLTHKRLFVAVFALAPIEYFDYTYKVPRLTLVLITPPLFVALPALFIWLRRPEAGSDRAIIVGDDLAQIAQIAAETDLEIRGYLCPTSALTTEVDMQVDDIDHEMRSVTSSTAPDGGQAVSSLERIGGLSRLEDVLVAYDVDTAMLVFTKADRAEFFGGT